MMNRFRSGGVLVLIIASSSPADLPDGFAAVNERRLTSV